MKEKIIEVLNSKGVYEIGFCKIEYFKELEDILVKHRELGFNTPFEVGSIEDKTFKNNSVYKSCIVCLVPYQKGVVEVSENEVYVSSSSWGVDYHVVLRSLLSDICGLLNDAGFVSEVCVDNNKYDERYLAYKAGLGFYGVNGLLINERLGSYFFIGCVLTDAVFEYDSELGGSCFGCMKCVSACPSGCISELGVNGNACLSYITQKKELDLGEADLIGQCIYGCDICSLVCPHNEVILEHDNFKLDKDLIINVDKYVKMSNKEFRRKYGKYAFSWRGKKVFERNIEIYKQKLEKRE